MERKLEKLLSEAKSCVEKGNFDKGLVIYEKAINKARGGSDYAYCLFLLASTLHDHGESERAAYLFEELKELYSHERPLAMKKLDSIYKQIGDINRRVAILEELSESQELRHDHIECSRTLIELSQIYIEMKRFENAESACLKALQLIEEVIGKKNDQYVTCLEKLVEVHRKSGNKEKETESLEKLHGIYALNERYESCDRVLCELQERYEEGTEEHKMTLARRAIIARQPEKYPEVIQERGEFHKDKAFKKSEHILIRKVFRVFVSSTFLDMKRERNVLQKKVFPRLREYCERHGASFQDIDLRWGVSDEVQKDQRTLQICLSEIERCQNLSPKPNFIILLGDRYGWEPLPYSIPSTEFDSLLPLMDESERSKISEWYRRDDNAIPSEYILQPRKDEYESYALWEEKERELREILRKAVDRSTLGEKEREKYFLSATHWEIIHGALGIPKGKIAPQEHVVACFRKGEKDERLQRLEEELKDRLSKERTREYESLESEKDEEEFSQFIYERLEETISLQLKDVQEIDELEEERNRHKEYKEELLEDFCGREKILEEISEYIEGEDNRIFALTGESGSGKSSVMAKAIEQAESEKNVVIYRFSGFTANSGNEYTLLKQLCEEITGKYNTTVNKVAGIEEGERPPVMEGSGERRSLDPNKLDDLIEVFRRCLVLSTEDKRLILFIDALDQIDGNLTWLPSLLPRYTKLVVSTTLDKEIELPHRLERLEKGEGEEILDRWLARAKRRLQREQREAIMNGLKSNGTPIYLRLLFDMAKNWHSYTGIPRLGEKTEEILKEFCDRLEREHTPERVKTIIGYMVCGRYSGLKEEELIDLLSFDEEYYESFLKGSQHTDELMERRKIPVVIWSRFYLDLEDHLREKEVEGVRLLTFFHRQIDEYMKERYGNNKKRNHSVLSDYGLKRFEDEGKNSKKAFLSSSIMPYVGFHLYEAEREKELLHLLPGEEETEEQGNRVHMMYNSFGWVMENYEFEEEKRLKALLEEISTIDRKVLADVMHYLGEWYKNRGKSLWCLFMYEKVVNIIERLVQKDPTNNDWQRDLGVSLNNVGSIHEGLGEGEKALEYYMRDLEISESLVKKDPDRTDWQRDLSFSLNSVGRILEKLDLYTLANEFYMRHLKTMESLVRKDPERTDWQRDFALSFANVGRIFEKIGEDDLAAEYYFGMLQIVETLVNKNLGLKHPEAIIHQRAFSKSLLQNLYGLDENLGETSMRFMELMESLVKKEPDRTDLQRVLSVSLDKMGEIHVSLGEGEKALEYYMKSLEIRESLVKKEPGRTDLQIDLSMSLTYLGKIHEAHGEDGKALEYYRRRLEISRSLVEKDLGVVGRYIDLVYALLDMFGVTENEDMKIEFVTEAKSITKSLADAGVSHPQLKELRKIFSL